MALTFTTNLPSTLDVNENDPINLTVVVSTDDETVKGVEFVPIVPGGATAEEVTGDGPDFTYTFTIPAAALTDSGDYLIQAVETDGAGNYIPDGPPSYSDSITTTVTVNEAPVVEEGLINGRTPEEHRRMYLLGYI